MIRYSIGHELIFAVLAMIGALSLLSQHPFLATVFSALAIVFVLFEHDLREYIKNA